MLILFLNSLAGRFVSRLKVKLELFNFAWRPIIKRYFKIFPGTEIRYYKLIDQ